MCSRNIGISALLTGVAIICCGCSVSHESMRTQAARVARVPTLVGEPWPIAGDPDLGELTDPAQEPVDFAIWPARDGSWQLWSCIRHTQCGGKTRLLHRWEGQRLSDHDWKPLGIAMQADAKCGETPGGLQAPFVFRDRDVTGAYPREIYYLVYGDWVHVCLARGDDGKHFERWLRTSQNGVSRSAQTAAVFSEDDEANTRDPMVIRVGDRWHCYYTAHPGRIGAAYCRTSRDLQQWSEATVVARGGRAGSGASSAECPFVVHLDGFYYLFRTQRYGARARTSVYRSSDPLNFGVDDDKFFIAELPVAAPEIIHHDDRWYLACLQPSLKGIQMYRLDWTLAAASSQPVPAAK